MPDIAGKLFPNLTTLIVQLLSTGVLLLIFKKFLWKNVMEYFAKRADYIESTINEAKEMNEKASVNLETAEKEGLLKEDDLFNNFIQKKGTYLWKKIKEIPFIQYRNSIKYLKEFFPIATQHSVKGSEYDNVLIILASNWNKYDFKTLFGKGSTNEAVKRRTKKLFYVSITRAKRNLVIYMPLDENNERDKNAILEKAKEYFGVNNVFALEELK